MSRPSQVAVSTDALQHNLKRVRELAPKSRVMVPVKCDAYGHGIKTTVQALTDADGFAVACIEEAMQTRQFTQKPIIILEGCYQSRELIDAEKNQFELIIHHLDQIEMLEKHQQPAQFQVWLKINTGMCRLGIKPSQFIDCWERLNACDKVAKPIKLMTHFANADQPDHPMNRSQIALFFDTIKSHKTICSLANSGATLAWPDTHADWVRPGIMMYGVSPFQDQTGLDHQLQPAMTLSSALIAIHDLNAGDKIGYCSRFECPNAMRIGIIAVGYGDGYPHALPDGAPVLIHGRPAPLVGNISMDMLAVDLSEHPDAKLNDSAILWGKGLPIETIARLANTIPYELLCNIHPRLRRV